MCPPTVRWAGLTCPACAHLVSVDVDTPMARAASAVLTRLAMSAVLTRLAMSLCSHSSAASW